MKYTTHKMPRPDGPTWWIMDENNIMIGSSDVEKNADALAAAMSFFTDTIEGNTVDAARLSQAEDYLVSHGSNVLNAMQIAKRDAPSHDDKDYWDHEIRALQKVVDVK